MRIVWNTHGEIDLLDWFVARLPAQDPRETWPRDQVRCAGMVDDRGALAGVVVFHHWSPTYRRVQVSAAAADPRWMRARQAWRALFDYAFDYLGVSKVYAETPMANARAMRFIKATGLKYRAVLQHHFGPGVHGMVSDLSVWEHRGMAAPATVTCDQWDALLAIHQKDAA